VPVVVDLPVVVVLPVLVLVLPAVVTVMVDPLPAEWFVVVV